MFIISLGKTYTIIYKSEAYILEHTKFREIKSLFGGSSGCATKIITQIFTNLFDDRDELDDSIEQLEIENMHLSYKPNDILGTYIALTYKPKRQVSF